MSYTKLAHSILGSTLWVEDDHTRIAWFTILALADRNGEVTASIPGLASIARIPVESCRIAIAKFLAPDPDSRTKTDDGRRLEEIPDGWFVINHEKYRAMDSDEDRKFKAADRQRRYRDRRRSGVTPRDKSHQKSQAEAEAEAEAEKSHAAHAPATPSASRAGRSGARKPAKAPTIPPEASQLADPPSAAPEAPTPPRARNAVWDAVADRWFGGNVAKPHAKRVGKVVRDLIELDATPDEINARADRISASWGSEKSTPESLVKHWHQFAHDPRPAKSDAERRREAADREFLDNLGAGLSAGGIAQLPSAEIPMLEGGFR